MRRTTAILLATIIIAGCDGHFRTKSFHSTVCGKDVTGFTSTAILYADSKLVVIPISDIRPDTEWRFILDPKLLMSKKGGYDFSDHEVSVSAKAGANNAWINTAGPLNGTIKGKYTNSPTLAACVNIPPNTPDGTEYEYIVKVDGLGQLDPRARVKR